MSSQVLNLFGGESPTKDLDEEVHKKKRKNLDIRQSQCLSSEESVVSKGMEVKDIYLSRKRKDLEI